MINQTYNNSDATGLRYSRFVYHATALFLLLTGVLFLAACNSPSSPSSDTGMDIRMSGVDPAIVSALESYTVRVSTFYARNIEVDRTDGLSRVRRRGEPVPIDGRPYSEIRSENGEQQGEIRIGDVPVGSEIKLLLEVIPDNPAVIPDTGDPNTERRLLGVSRPFVTRRNATPAIEVAIYEYVSDFTPVDAAFVAGSTGGEVRALFESGDTFWSFDDFDGEGIADIDVGPNGDVYVVADDMTVRRLSPFGREIWRVDYPSGTSMEAVAVDNDGNVYASAFESNPAVIRKFDPDGQLIWTYEITAGFFQVRFLEIAPDGNLVATARGNIYKIDPNDSAPAELWSNTFVHGNTIWAMTVDSSGNIYTGDWDGQSGPVEVIKHDSAGTEDWSFPVTRSVESLAASPGGGSVYALNSVSTAAEDITLFELDVANGNEITSYTDVDFGSYMINYRSPLVVVTEDAADVVYYSTGGSIIRGIGGEVFASGFPGNVLLLRAVP